METTEIRFAEWWFTDLSGKPWRMDVAASHMKEAAFQEGITLDGPSTGRPWRELLTLMPDRDSCWPDPVAGAATTAVFCDVRQAETGSTLLDSRSALRRAEERLRGLGVAERLVLGAECEFFLLEEAHGPASPEETVWDFLRELAVALGRAGISVEGFRFGPAAGQGRVQMRQERALKTADQVLFHQYVAKTLARRLGRVVAFVPKPLPGLGAASLPVHHSLWNGERNLFHCDAGWGMTSDFCRFWAGGLLAHAPALLAFCAPTVNSYRRLGGGGAPTALVLSRALPQAACRIPARSAAPGSRRIKFRLCDATVNPYLAFAAMLMAGLDGVTRRLAAPIESDAPAAVLPRTLDSALEALEADSSFLTAGGVFSPQLIEAWTVQRRQSQIEALRALPHPMERLAQPDQAP